MGSRLDKNSDSVRKRIANHFFDDEEGDEYEGSAFGGFGEYFRRKKIKLQNLDADIRSQAGDKPRIFKGIVAHVNGYTQPSLNDLHKLIVQHGGGFLPYLDGKTMVTHVIASSLTLKKAVEFKRYRIVKPAWVVDSIKAGKLLPWNDYRVVDEGDKQNVLAFDQGKVMSQANVKPKGYRDQTDTSWYTHQLKESQSGLVTTYSPTSTQHSQSLRPRRPALEDDVDDPPPSHQPEPMSDTQTSARINTEKLNGSQKTALAAHSPAPEQDLAESGNMSDDSLYDDPTPPDAQQPRHDNKPRDEAETANDNDTLQHTKKQLTAEEHNAILLMDPKIRKSTAVDPNFLEQYYRESRLHHLSTWKADLKSQLQALASEKSLSQRAKHKRPLGARRYILHVDFDSFFAAVSLKKHPQFKDKPAVVAHGQGSGSEIASCNYVARRFGIKNGMWMKRAQELCPDLKILPYDFPAYEQVSRAFYDAILATGGLVQSVSIDEALLDVSNICIAAGGSDDVKMQENSIYREQDKADNIAQSLRDEVKAKTECNVSVGIGGNILLAKVALRKAKPAGQYQIKPEEVLGFIGELQVQDLPGVAWSIGGKLEEIGVKFVKDIRETSKEKLIQTLGPKTGGKLWEYSRGIDRQEVGEQVVRKSVSADVTWGIRFENQEQADEFIKNLCGELEKRLLKEKVRGKHFTMKIMRRSLDSPLDPPKHLGHGKCDTFNKSLVLGVATNSKELLTKEALGILRGFGFSPGELRGIGVQMTKLEPLKNTSEGTLESSQRRLQFKVGNKKPAKAPEKRDSIEDDPIQDEPETPRKPKTGFEDDHVGFGADELNHSTPSRRPLNIMGTQFIMPTQVDPKVLAELPDDIRSKLQKARKSSPTPAARRSNRNQAAKTPTKEMSFAMTALPAQSQLDPQILAALPADLRAEVLAQYDAGATPATPSRRPRSANQTMLPQSPHKNRIIGIPAKKAPLPVKRGRGRPPKSAMLAASAQATALSKTGKTLTQAKFISLKNPARDSRVIEASPTKNRTNSSVVADIDPDFLSALPEDLRKEVIEDHHQRQKMQAMHLSVPTNKRNKPTSAPAPPRPSPVIKIPRPKKPTFTTQKLSKEKHLRTAIKEWAREFADDGPYKEDVAALAKYLERVVCEERNLAKAEGLVKWFEYVIDEKEETLSEEAFVASLWREALGVVKEGVNRAAGRRGLGMVCEV